MVPAHEHKTFSIDKVGFNQFADRIVLADQNLLNQVADATISNAFKYASVRSTIEVMPWLEDDSELFEVRVLSTGIRLEESEIEKCIRPGWRADAAIDVDQDGSGLGLWLCTKLMEFQDGTLIVEPSDEDDQTVVKICLPLAFK